MHPARTARRLAVSFASALVLSGAAPALAGTDVTYPQLNNQTTVQDTDLLAVWRATGPLAKANASVLAAYLQAKFNAYYLQPSNNLSDVGNITTARSNLGLGSAATAATGTSGAALCLLNQNCTWSGTQLFQAKITTGTPSASGAMFNLAPGAAPTSPVNGDVWGTSSGVFGQVNGATQQFAFLTSNITGNAATASKWQTARTESLTGDVTGSASVDGSGNWSIPTTLATVNSNTGACGDSSHVAQVTLNAKGLATGCSAVAISYPSQLPSQSGNGGGVLGTDGSNPKWITRASASFQGYSGSIGNVYTTNATITRDGTGCYHISFSNAFPNNGYTFIGTAGNYNSAANYIVVEADSWYARSTSAIGFCVMNGGSAYEGASSVNVLVLAN